MTLTVITGANSGIGRATAVHLAGLGHTVYGTARNPDGAGKVVDLAEAAGGEVRLVQMDVTDAGSVTSAFDRIVGEAGPVDVLVNNAGIADIGTVEDTALDRFREVYETNVFGQVAVIQAVVGSMRERRSGHIVNVSSIGGVLPLLGQAAYSSSKWAFEGLSEILAQDLAPFGVHVSVIEPGVIMTAMLAKTTHVPGDGSYQQIYDRMFLMYQKGIERGTSADAVAEVIAEAIASPTRRFRWTVGPDAAGIVAGLESMGPADRIAMAGAATDDDYKAMWADHYGFDL